ncbi:hypothetical protein NEOLEDRAFT_1133763 [Neolentinus lepideus HHB14362 ss-1]|uniref:Alpha/gamma-adaptin-binding protein p34 n=1 Tax=Neolentinus lepideus HHB14362 ss-1 TaxID=1314782 RepID=A0A165SMK8_9AGAM|nr:hypothetical protein NEOLEDRAFT_1133763 [Neolentinus lepideus HHB14362 ss-1]
MSDSDTASCRILTVSSSTAQARTFIGRLKALSGDPSAVPDEGSVRWTIANRYYTADVHFEVVGFEQWNEYLAEGVPAVIYVWAQEEPYKDRLPLVAKALKGHDTEVSLAVRIAGKTQSATDSDEGVDEFIASHGFEFIDGESNVSQSDEHTSDHRESGIPGLPRVVDALSTIMWPSMVQTQATRNRKSRAHDLLGLSDRDEEADGLRSLLNADDSIEDRDSRMKKEMEDLAQWLEEDNPWSSGTAAMQDANSSTWARSESVEGEFLTSFDTGPTSGALTPTVQSSWPSHATEIEQDLALAADGGEFLSGFDDDFSAFVSVSAPADYDTKELPDASASFEAERLMPMHTGASYRSLASDFDSDGPDIPDWGNEEEDEDLPSQTEIEATSRRIFGSLPDSINPIQSEGAPQAGSSSSGPEDDRDYEMSAFDLSKVVGALQVMKEEIAEMEDEGERRRAAARVALGLVYGLEAEKSNDLEEPEQGPQEEGSEMH